MPHSISTLPILMASVNGGKVLMIKAINTDSASGSICYVSDTNLTVLQ